MAVTTWLVCRRALAAVGKTEYAVFTELQLARAHPAWELVSGSCSRRQEALLELGERLAEDPDGIDASKLR
jgi:hypothetical protein